MTTPYLSRCDVDSTDYDESSFTAGYDQGRYDEAMAQGPSQQQEQIVKLTKERDHWKANHDAQVQRARILHDRPDLPLERVQAYKQVGVLTAERDEYRRKFQEADLMAECTTLLRDDLIKAGIVESTVPPMMLTEAVMAHVSKLTAERDAAPPASTEPACPNCQAPGLFYECVWCSANNYPKDVRKVDTLSSGERDAIAAPEQADTWNDGDVRELSDAEIIRIWDGHTVPVFGKIGINRIVFARAVLAAQKARAG